MIKALIVTIIYTITLYLISPIIDHAFSPLDEENDDYLIMIEALGQIIAVSVMWYLVSEYLITFLNKYFKVKNDALLDKGRQVIAGVVIVGLQTHLIKKLEHLTHKHPFRFLNLYED